MSTASATTIDPAEIERFSRIADQWWDPSGKFRPLHRINPLRIDYIKRQVTHHFADRGLDNPTNHDPRSAIRGLRLLDIGCGGGLIAEPMARLGATVTGIDAAQKNIAVARLHAIQSDLTIAYECTTAEALAAALPLLPESRTPNPESRFDIVLALEIIEHVADPELFVQSCLQLVKPNGLLILSTINRTPKAYALAIVGAEMVLRWLPRGTHEWKKFLRPSELNTLIERHGGQLKHMTGMVMNPLTFAWRLEEKDMSVNYLMTVAKPK